MLCLIFHYPSKTHVAFSTVLAAMFLLTILAAQAVSADPSGTSMSPPWPEQPQVRQVYDFDQGWHFMRVDQIAPSGPPSPSDNIPALTPALSHDSEWPLVNLPHTVRLEPLNASGGRNFQGVCWYTKHFPLKPSWRGRTIYLRFDGAMSVADVWLNDVHLTTHYCGYLPFTVPISSAVNFAGDNVLVVRLDNSDNPEVPPGKPQGSLDFVYFGGLYRPVHLDVLAPLHITDPILANKVAGGGVFVTYPKVTLDDAVVAVQTDVANEESTPAVCQVTQTLIAPNGSAAGMAAKTVSIPSGQDSEISQQIDVPAPKLWHPYHPYLYVLHTVVSKKRNPVDDFYTRIGIRSFRFDATTGLYINGEHFVSMGANRHQDHPYVGYAIPDSDQYRDAKLLRDAGLTSYRSHYPMAQSWMDACDELGILAIVSNPGWQFMGDDLFKQRVYQDCRDMIRWNRNHPSALLWEAQLNETDNRPVAPALLKIVHAEDPGPGVFASGDHIDAFDDFPGWDVDYGGRVPTIPGWWREWGDSVNNWGDQQSSNRVDRTWGETPMLVQAWAHAKSMDNVVAAAQPQVTGETSGWLSGYTLWAGIDCYRGYHEQPFLGGIADLFRIPKFDYYLFQSQRTAQDLHIPNVDGGPMVYVANFATPYSPTTVTVFSNCEQVRLSENGKVIGTQSPDLGHAMAHPPFSFHIAQIIVQQSTLFATGVAQPGTEASEIKAEGLIGGQVVATYEVKTPGVPRQIALTADLKGKPLTADGSDWVRVYASICDAAGTVYPLADNPVTFTVAGQGTVIGDATIGANPTVARAGIATALIQATTQPGDITVTASSSGLRSSTLVLHSVSNKNPVWP